MIFRNIINDKRSMGINKSKTQKFFEKNRLPFLERNNISI